ncbi:Androglobin [Holothuria leucospilota]|uniref:Androglobin n=1 Tax=Holothuria leucospilota TaxID=206669 RepID=A0A9Q1BGC2_HOLLE|nr:Androglobin [Holothuria leucospilota]
MKRLTKRSSVRLSASSQGAASIAASVVGSQEGKKQKLLIWPEWSDADINAEKWDPPHKAKEKEKGKSPSSMQHFFDDPDGKIEMPSSLRYKVDHWQRPTDFITDKTPVIYDQDRGHEFDLMTDNEVVECEVIRWVVAQITNLWKISALPPGEQGDPALQTVPGAATHSWRPWDHIFALCKVGKGPHQPQYNPHGKYIIKLYWMGTWRKIIVDDSIPFDDNGRILLPTTNRPYELWPMLLAKGLIKVLSLDYTPPNGSCEFNDASVIHALTGWLPETIPLQDLYLQAISQMLQAGKEDKKKSSYHAGKPPVEQGEFPVRRDWDHKQRSSESLTCVKESKENSENFLGYGHLDKVWALLKDLLPEFKLPEMDAPNEEKQENGVKCDTKQEDAASSKESKKDEKVGKDKDRESKSEKGDKEPKGGKDHKEDKKKDKDKDKDKHKEVPPPPIPDSPQVAVFVSYIHPPKVPVRVSVLGEMADASERLRQAGLSHVYPHPLLLTQTRSCPLVAPTPPPVIPNWKLIRPRKKKPTPTDEPSEPEIKKPEQFIELTSPYVNYKVSPIPIPTETKRPKSSLSRGASRPSTALMNEICEVDENANEMEEEDKEKEESPKEPVDVQKPPDLLSPAVTANSSPRERRKSAQSKREKSAVKSEKSDKGEEKLSTSPAPKKSAKKGKGGAPAAEKNSEGGKGGGKGKGEAKEKESDKGSKDPTLKPTEDSLDTASMATDAVSRSGLGEDGLQDGEAGPEIAVEADKSETEPVKKEIWMDFEDFCKCFKTLYIFHKPHTYPNNHKYSDLKVGLPTAGKRSAAPGGPFPSASITAQTPARMPFSPSPQHHSSPEDRPQQYLFVDNLESSEIIISFSSLSRWFDPPSIEPPKTSHSHREKEKQKDNESVAGSSIAAEAPVTKPDLPITPVPPGLLVAEPYSWKSLVVGQPILRIRTTSTKVAALTLPPGRHVLRFMMTAPMGFHIHLCSRVPFVFGDEETVMQHLTEESCRFVDHAVMIMNCLGNAINSFDDPPQYLQAMLDLDRAYRPVKRSWRENMQNYEIFRDALYSMLRKALGEDFTLEMAFAWKAFNFDALTRNIAGISYSGSRPATGASRKSGKTRKSDVPESWANREATEEEINAVTTFARHWRGVYVRKIKAARVAGSEENKLVKKQLVDMWNILKEKLEENSLHLFRSMFKADPDLMQFFPFSQDEWNKIAFVDFQGNCQDQPSNTWFVVFRDVFHVHEPMLVVPKLYVSIPTCMLRVVNNDTGEEIPRVFQRVAPYEYQRNRNGYTFVGEARTTDLPLNGGKWRMRLIGSATPLPRPLRENLNSNFTVKEIKDYYIPNKNFTIMRYFIKPSQDHIASIQFCTSKPDVYISLQILDHEEEVASTKGKGHAVIPAFKFLRDREPGEEERGSSSRSSAKGNRASSTSLGSGKRNRSATSNDGRASAKIRESSSDFGKLEGEIDENEFKPHKYVVQAKVLRKSWPLSESSWAFVQVLKELEKNELKANKERPASPGKGDGKNSSSRGDKGKKGKDKGKEKEKEKGSSRPPSQQFDHTKPYWTLRIVLDQTPTDEVDIIKDTERQDEIRAMKQAWEAAEPGRAAKAQATREKFMKEHMIKVEPEEKADEPKELEQDAEVLAPPETPASEGEPTLNDTILTNEPPPPPPPKEILKRMDLTPFIRPADFSGEPRLKDEVEIERQMKKKQEIIQQYKVFREQVLNAREEDKRERTLTKEKQLQECIELQTSLDERRNLLNQPREAFRQTFLEAERKRLEEIAAAEAALKAEQAKRSPSPKGRKSPKGKKSPKKSGKKKK